MGAGNSAKRQSEIDDEKQARTKFNYIARQRFYNAHHTWNEMRDDSGNDLMFEFIRNCHTEREKEKNCHIFHTILNKLISSIPPYKHSLDRVRNKKLIRCMRLIHAWMTLAINNNKFWTFREMGNILKQLYDENKSNLKNRIIVDYDRITGDLLCLCTLKKKIDFIKFMVLQLHICVNLSCEGGESPLVICAEHNFPEIALFLLSCGADANNNNHNLSDSSNSPAQISASWQHLKVLYFLIIYGANTIYMNIHLRSVEQYAKDNHLINYIVQKALNKQLMRKKGIKKILYKMLLHPHEFDFHFKDCNHSDIDSESFDYDQMDFDFEFPNEGNMDNFKMHFGDNYQIKKQIQCNISNSMKYLKKRRNSNNQRRNSSSTTRSSVASASTSTSMTTVASSDGLCENVNECDEDDGDRVYLLKDIVSIIYSMII